MNNEGSASGGTNDEPAPENSGALAGAANLVEARLAWAAARPTDRKRVYAMVWAHRAFGEAQADMEAELSARAARFRARGEEMLAEAYEAARVLLAAGISLELNPRRVDDGR